MAKNIKTHAAPSDEQLKANEAWAKTMGSNDAARQVTLCRRMTRRQGSRVVAVAISDEPTCKQCQKRQIEMAASTMPAPVIADSEALLMKEVEAYRIRLRDLGRWDLLS